MRRWIVSGAVLLALSTAVNVMAVSRLRAPVPRPAAAPPDDRLVREVEALRGEVARLRKEPPPPARVEEVDDLLSDQEAVSRLWARLDHLRAVRRFLTDEKFEEAALRVTGEGLRLDGRFSETARVVLAELRQAARRHGAELAKIAADGTPGLGEAYADERRRSVERLSSTLDPRPLHQLFRERLDEWVTYVLSE